jgi:hypothetical protein
MATSPSPPYATKFQQDFFNNKMMLEKVFDSQGSMQHDCATVNKNTGRNLLEASRSPVTHDWELLDKISPTHCPLLMR